MIAATFERRQAKSGRPRGLKSLNAYNLGEVTHGNAMRLRLARRIAAVAALTVFCAFSCATCAQAQASADVAGGNSSDLGAGGANGSRVLLVLPFDNRTGQPNLEWVREAAAVTLTMRFASAGFQPTSRADRMYALDHLGLPQGFQPSRASALKLAQTLDADSIVVGSYTTDGSGIVAEATLVDVPDLRMMPEVSARGEMKDLIAVFSDAGVEADEAA